jgi:pSer/pThr/pTyr-binding forkhead associated (FHA) protein
VVGDEEESQEMIAPELVFPEEFGEDARKSRSSASKAARVLVFLDEDMPIKYPLYKNVMTIGRSEQADIQVNGDFISRVHARLVSTENGVIVEDVDSKNGIRVNSKLTDRHPLRHGDVIGLGKLRFTFIDTSALTAD